MKTHSDSLDSIAPALVAAQAEMRDVVATETADTGKYAYKYCDLASVREAVLPVLTKHGMGVTQTVVPRREGLFGERFCVLASVRTMLLHSSGQWIAGEHPIAGDWGDAQRIGSAITYARRYGLAAICGVAQVDDDGSAARVPAPRAERSAAPNRASREPGDDDFGTDDGDFRPGDPVYERAHAAAPDSGQRAANREERHAAYREAYPAPQTNGDAPPRSAREPRTGKQLFGWAKDRGELPFFSGYGKEMNLPRQFNDWDERDVEDAMRAFHSRRTEPRNGNGRH